MVGSQVMLQDGFAQIADAGSGPLKPGEVGTVVEIGEEGFDNSNVCSYSNDRTCDETNHINYDGSDNKCFNGTDTSDCNLPKDNSAGRHLSDTTLVLLLGAVTEICQDTHTNVRAVDRVSTWLFIVSLFSYFQSGSPSLEGLVTRRSINMSRMSGSQRRAMKSYKVDMSGGAVWWYQEGAIRLHTCLQCVAGECTFLFTHVRCFVNCTMSLLCDLN